MAPLTPQQFVKLYGLTEAARQMKALPRLALDAFGDAAYLTAQLVASRAAGKAPKRKTPLGGYTGGALRQHIAASQNKTTGEAQVGIHTGLLVVRSSGRTTAVTQTRTRQRSRLVLKGKRAGTYVKTSYKMLLRRDERARVRRAGSLIIQPTKYGHFSEFGKGGRSGAGVATPWLQPTVEQSQDFFLVKMRAAAAASELALARMGVGAAVSGVLSGGPR